MPWRSWNFINKNEMLKYGIKLKGNYCCVENLIINKVPLSALLTYGNHLVTWTTILDLISIPVLVMATIMEICSKCPFYRSHSENLI